MLIGMGRAMRLAMTGEFLDAGEAEKVGLVNWAVPDADLGKRTGELAKSLVSRSPAALRSIKRAPYRQRLGRRS
jgi:enoyl-CoA hydratase/carnithine racemase